MEVSIGARPDAAAALDRLHDVLAGISPRVIACSGGVDSLVLATVAHRSAPDATTVAHTVTPAVPADATDRVAAAGRAEGWALEFVRSREFDDERYLSNPTDRCYFCKSNLYDALDELTDRNAAPGATLLSGANTDDLGEYRPGLAAAREHDVRHPFVEAAIGKAEIRAIARRLGLGAADLPASPCLASRLYTGTRVTPARLAAVEAGEAVVRRMTGLGVVRCRIDGSDVAAMADAANVVDGDLALVVTIEVEEAARDAIDGSVVAEVAAAMREVEPRIGSVRLDDRPYESGRAFVHHAS